MFFTYILFTSEKKKKKTSAEEVKITKSKKIKMETKNICQGETHSR